MAQTQSSYAPPKPHDMESLRHPGLFASDPAISECTSDNTCAALPLVCIVDSQSLLILGVGLYGWVSGRADACQVASSCHRQGLET